MIIQKLRLCLSDIEAFFYLWYQSLVGELENGGQDATDHVVQIFEVS